MKKWKTNKSQSSKKVSIGKLSSPKGFSNLVGVPKDASSKKVPSGNNK